LLWIKTTALNR